MMKRKMVAAGRDDELCSDASDREDLTCICGKVFKSSSAFGQHMTKIKKCRMARYRQRPARGQTASSSDVAVMPGQQDTATTGSVEEGTGDLAGRNQVAPHPSLEQAQEQQASVQPGAKVLH